jgi:hypothetical protein
VDAEFATALYDSLALTERALGACARLEDDNSALRAKTAEQERVILEKVAASKAPVLDPNLIDATLDALTSMSLMDPADHQKLAADLSSDPNAALRLAQRLVTLSVPAHQEGSAIDKSAGLTGADVDPDGWHLCVRPRAAH